MPRLLRCCQAFFSGFLSEIIPVASTAIRYTFYFLRVALTITLRLRRRTPLRRPRIRHTLATLLPHTTHLPHALQRGATHALRAFHDPDPCPGALDRSATTTTGASFLPRRATFSTRAHGQELLFLARRAGTGRVFGDASGGAKHRGRKGAQTGRRFRGQARGGGS